MFLCDGGRVAEPGGNVLERVLFRQFCFAGRAHILEELFPRGDARPVQGTLEFAAEGLEFHISENQGRGTFGEALEVVHECQTHFREQWNCMGSEVSGSLLVLVRLLGHFNIEFVACQVHVFPFHEPQFRGDAQASEAGQDERKPKLGVGDLVQYLLCVFKAHVMETRPVRGRTATEIPERIPQDQPLFLGEFENLLHALDVAAISADGEILLEPEVKLVRVIVRDGCDLTVRSEEAEKPFAGHFAGTEGGFFDVRGIEVFGGQGLKGSVRFTRLNEAPGDQFVVALGVGLCERQKPLLHVPIRDAGATGRKQVLQLFTEAFGDAFVRESVELAPVCFGQTDLNVVNGAIFGFSGGDACHILTLINGLSPGGEPGLVSFRFVISVDPTLQLLPDRTGPDRRFCEKAGRAFHGEHRPDVKRRSGIGQLLFWTT